jgi:hypothetical protein
MATLYVSEYRQIGQVPSANSYVPATAQAPQEPSVADQVVSISGSSTQSAVFGGYTQMIRVHTDAICSIVIGDNPIAASTNKRLAANQTEYFGVSPGQKIAVITNV